MNTSIIIGRLTRDPELKEIRGEKTDWVCNFTLAVNMPLASKETTYFIPCVVWGGKAKALADYQRKGDLIGVRGHLQTRSYEKDGQTIRVIEVFVAELDFYSKSKEKQSITETKAPISIPQASKQTTTDYQDYQRDLFNHQVLDKQPTISDDELPF